MEEKKIDEDLRVLLQLDLIEIKGITDDGQWLYGITEKALNLSEKEIVKLISSFYEEGNDEFNFC